MSSIYDLANLKAALLLIKSECESRAKCIDCPLHVTTESEVAEQDIGCLLCVTPEQWNIREV